MDAEALKGLIQECVSELPTHHDFDPALIAMVRRRMSRGLPNLANVPFISTQPMNTPSGLIFFMDYKYGNTSTKKSKP